MDRIKSSLDDLSLALVGWEDGNLMALSALADQAQALKTRLDPDPQAGPLAAKVDRLLAETLSGSLESLPRADLGRGLDLLAQLLEAREEGTPVPGTWGPAARDWLGVKDDRPLPPPVSEAMSIFLAEAHDRLTEAQSQVLELEANPGDKDAVDMLFRTFHTIKGECGFLKIPTLGELAHHFENLLDLLRDRTLVLDDEVVGLLFSGIDRAQDILGALGTGDRETFSPRDLPGLLDRIKAKIAERKKPIGDLLVASGKLTDQEVETILTKQRESAYTKKFGEIAAEESLVTHEEIAQQIQEQKTAAGPTEAVRNDPLIKVHASQVNYLVDMIGELLIIENQLDEFDPQVIQLKKISRSIQTSAMELRTVKVKNLFINLKRLTRDAAKQLGKTVAIETLGEDLEVDRNLVELLEEPLMHLVRNSVGHGIEDTGRRRAAGKPEVGTVVVQALRRGNSIVISVRDDGAGLDVEKILDKAVAKGLVPADRRHQVTVAEAHNLIFLPGFSTADEVNAISGRGVGMDIVKTTVASARGRVEIKSEVGRFTEFSLIFPLNLAIIYGMIVTCGGTHYILPISNIVETLSLEPDSLKSVEDRAAVLDLRQEIIPVIYMKEYFQGEKPGDTKGFAVIVEHDDQKFALVCDQVLAKREVVIKNLGKKFKQLPGISSAAVLPGGKIGFVVAVEDVVKA